MSGREGAEAGGGEGGEPLGVVIFPGVLPDFPVGKFGSRAPTGLGLNPGSARAFCFAAVPARRQ